MEQTPLYRIEVYHRGRWQGFAFDMDYASMSLISELWKAWAMLPRPPKTACTPQSRFWFTKAGWDLAGARCYNALAYYVDAERLRLRMRDLKPTDTILHEDEYQYALA